MHPVTHLLAGWAIANAADLDPRDSAIVAVAGAAPDLDGLGWVVEAATFNTDTPLVWYSEYHHVLGHNIGFCLLYCAVALLLGHRRLLVGVTAFLSFHLHLLFDLAGSRGADGYQWPIPYLKPFSDAWQLVVSRDAREESIKVHQDVDVFRGRLEAGAVRDHELAPGRHAWVQIVAGDVEIAGHRLKTGDAVAVGGESLVRIKSIASSDVLLFDLA